MLRQKLSDSLKAAMIAQDKSRLGTLRLILAALKDRDIAERPNGGANGIGEPAILQMLQSMIKQRQDSIEIYKKGGRPELASKEAEEIEVIEEFLPKQLSDAEIRQIVVTTIKDKGAQSPKDMGIVMAVLKETYVGQMDFSLASRLVKEILAP